MRAGCVLVTAIILSALLAPHAVAQEQVPKGKLAGSITPVAYRIDLTVVPSRPRFSGHVEIDVTARGGEQSMFLHGRDLKVKRTELRQGDKKSPATYTQVDPSGVARISFGRALEAGTATLAFDYDAPFATGSAGLYRLEVAGQHYAWTQLEAIDARGVFPCFDEPGFKTPFTVSLTTTKGVLAVSNEMERESVPDKTLIRHVFAPTANLPTYLVALAVGPFDVLADVIPPTPERARPLPLRMIATKGQQAKLAYALSETKPIVKHLEAYFRRAFPFSKLDQIASPLMGGAMENAGAVIYDDTLVVLGDDAPVTQKQRFGMVTAHELAHQWFGDLVTPAWWDDIWLNESFANWLGYRVAEQWNHELNIGVGAVEEALNAMSLDALSVGRPIRQTIATSGEIDSAFDAITYGKGGQVISMIESYLGAAKFQRGVVLHMQRFAGKSATSDDFFRSLADAAGDPRIIASMRSFVDQQGVPVVRVERAKDGLLVTQKRYVQAGAGAVAETKWTIPFCLRQDDAKYCTLLERGGASLRVTGKGALIPNAGGLGYYRFSLTDAEWQALIGASATLTAVEALASLDSLWADFRAGGVGFSRLLQAARAFAAHRDSNVATSSGERLSALRTRGLVPEAALPGYQKLINELYAPRLSQLGFDPRAGSYAKENSDTQALRSQLVGFLLVEARDAAIQTKLADAAAAWLDGDASALDRTYYGAAFAAWLARTGPTGTGKLWAKATASSDAFERKSLLSALSHADNRDVAGWLLAHTSDPKLRSSEKLHAISGLTSELTTRALGFAWLEKNFVRLARETNLSSVNYLFSMPNGFCTTAAADKVEAALRPQVRKLGRGALPLDRAIEIVRSCAATEAARGAEIVTALSAHAGS